MKLDSEEQRTQLLELLGTVVLQVRLGEADSLGPQADAILDPIRNAQIERTPNKGKR